MKPSPSPGPGRTWVWEELQRAHCWAEEQGTGSFHSGTQEDTERSEVKGMERERKNKQKV